MTTSQDQHFLSSEGDAWFRRNEAACNGPARFDWPLELATRIGPREAIRNVAELGCANGWRLDRLSRHLGKRWVGVDAGATAIADGQARFSQLELHHGELADLPLKEGFDLVIVNFVLHWIDRSTLARVAAEIDRVVADGGWLIVGDFLPDHLQRRTYHHLPGQGVYTYKQDYAQLFTRLGTYAECSRVAYNHDRPADALAAVPSGERAACVLLHKSLTGLYAEA